MSDTWDAAPEQSSAPQQSWDSAPLAGVSTQTKAVISANDNGDEAAKALTIGKQIGVAPSVVQSDIPGYEAHARQQQAKTATENPYIAKYVDNTPHAASISGDDYENLENSSRTFQALSNDKVNARAQGGLLQTIPAVAQALGSSAGREALWNITKTIPTQLYHGLEAMFTLPGDIASGKKDLNTDEGLNEGISLGIAIALGGAGPRGTVRTGISDANIKLAPRSTPEEMNDFLHTMEGMRTRQEIDDFIAAKTGKPVGPQLLIAKADAGAAALDSAVEVAQDSKTKQRSPETFAEFGDAHKTGMIHIDGQIILDLYKEEGKAPASGDGILGFVPGLAGNIQTAADVGGEVSIPVSDYVAHIDPTVHEKLRDNIRVHDDGATLKEAEEEKDELSKKPREGFKGEEFPNTGVAPAIIDSSGVIHVGRKNGQHFEINTGDFNLPKDVGFVNSNGDFLNREQALEWVEKNEKNIKPSENMKGKLDALDYREQVPEDIRIKAKTPIEQSIITEVGKQRAWNFLNNAITDAKAVGITEPEFAKYNKLIKQRNDALIEGATETQRREVSRALAPEWKRNETKVRDEVITEARDTGKFAAERFLRENKIELNADPIEYADNLAPLFGYANGTDLLYDLDSLRQEQAASGRTPQSQYRDFVKEETSLRMQQRHGNLKEIIAEEARFTALANHTFDILAAEVRILANAAGVTPPLGRQALTDWAKGRFEKSNIKDAENYQKASRAVAKGGRETEKALLKGDFLEAFQAKQRQMLAAVIARQSLDFQKLINTTEKKILRYSTEQTISSMDQGSLEQIRQMFASVGLPQNFAPLADTGPLRDFVAEAQGKIAAAPWLMDGRQPKLGDMTVEQFRAFSDTLKSMENFGRDAKLVRNAQQAAELENVVHDAVRQLERFNFIDQPLNPTLGQRVAAVGRQIIGAHLLVERMFDYTDRFNPHGPITEYLDRPLRDANTKEIELTEQVTKMLRDLAQYTDTSVNRQIPNDLIQDKTAKSGFANLRGYNLRQLMLNTGNESNLKKLVEGYGITEGDLKKFVSKHATAADVAWTNGVWKIFDHLKPEADAMQLRDTGVPVDTIPAVGWEVSAGQLKGGYYPIVYDKFNSNIVGHLASKDPIFDNQYVSATTPHGYTQERTDFQGALDLSGSFLASRIKGMVHDIAFREAVRNANKLISNEAFRLAVAQYWGKEYAELLPGWLKDIANSHRLDDVYAQGIVKAMSVVRQNIVSTLIAYNPGTFIKHGFTAAVMSAGQVGMGPLMSALNDIGIKGGGGAARDIIRRYEGVDDPEAFMQAFRDTIDTGARGDNVRGFIMESSAVMRNRQRQWNDSVRGAVNSMNEAGIAQTFSEFRQRQMMYGRMAVAFSDSISAMPTWYAAYREAYLRKGESHEDAVFIADKAVSRAHGSSFVGDQPRVTRLHNTVLGEFGRWFVTLYNFWNHQVNNNLQLMWDAAAALSGPNEISAERLAEPNRTQMAQDSKGTWKYAAEPGANGWEITKRVGQIMAIIWIEEQATAPLNEDNHGLLTHMTLASLRYFGGGFIGAREITNGLAGGYEPSTGMLGTMFRAGADTVKDIGKSTGLKAGAAKDWIKHTATAVGFALGIGGAQIGRTGQFAERYATGQDRPQNFTQFRQGIRTGRSQPYRRH